MKKFKLIAASLLASSVLFVGCEKKKDNPVNPGPAEETIFTTEKLGNFVGEFYAQDYVLSISQEGATLSKAGAQISLTNGTIEGTNFATKATYSDEEGKSYSLEWKSAYWDKNALGLELPTLTFGEEEIQFQPSVSSIQGWYDGWDGEMSESLAIYIISNEFDIEANAFQMYSCNFSYQFIDKGFHLFSSYVDYAGATRLALSWFDNLDLERGYNESDWNYYVTISKETNEIVLNTISSVVRLSEPYWWTRPSMLLGSYWKEEYEDYGLDVFYESGLFFTFDETEKTVYVEYDEEPLTLTSALDEEGSYYIVGDMIIRGTTSGILITTEEGTKDYIPFFTSDLFNLQDCEYKLGDETVGVLTDWDTWESYFSINGEHADSVCVSIYENKLAYKATYGEDVYYMLPFDGYYGATVIKNEEVNVYLNEEYLGYLFVGDYYFSNGRLLRIDYDLNVLISTGEFDYGAYDYVWNLVGQGNYVYSKEYESFTLAFDENSMIIPLDQEKYIFAIISGENSDFLISTMTIDMVFGNWSSGTSSLIVSDSIIMNEQEYDFYGYNVFLSAYGEILPALTFGFEETGESYIVLFDNSGLVLYDGETLEFIDTFVDEGILGNAFGTYCYYGAYGIETIKFEEDGTLTVDTLNEDGTGNIPVVYDYDVSINDSCLLEVDFYIENGGEEFVVPLIFDGNGHCSIFEINYLSSDFLAIQGLYGTNAENVFTVCDTNFFLNGTKFDLSSSHNGVFTGYFGFDYYSISFDTNSVTIEKTDGETIILIKNEISVSTFKTGIHENVAGLSRDIKVEDDGIYIRNTGSEEFTKVTEFYYVIDDAGNVSIQFNNSFAYTFTISIVDGEVVITGESSLPPLPPIF